MLKIEIDNGSGFCFGVTTAIQKAEEELASGGQLYCLGDIVHNGMECERLRQMGLITINHEQLRQLHHAKVLLRAHGEPPETYRVALEAQIVIFGKPGHAEVLGLVGQTSNHAIVVAHFEDVSKLDFSRDIYLYSQTTKNLGEFHRIIEYIQQHISPDAVFRSFDTICRQVANRMPNICNFAARHDLVLFVCGHKSSNGKVLYGECRRVNPNSYQIESASEIDERWLQGVSTIGICGATSTPKWLMEECRDHINQLVGQ